jgi:hypothetical protein
MTGSLAPGVSPSASALFRTSSLSPAVPADPVKQHRWNIVAAQATSMFHRCCFPAGAGADPGQPAGAAEASESSGAHGRIVLRAGARRAPAAWPWPRARAEQEGNLLSSYHSHSGHSSASDGNGKYSHFTLPYTVRARSSGAMPVLRSTSPKPCETPGSWTTPSTGTSAGRQWGAGTRKCGTRSINRRGS